MSQKQSQTLLIGLGSSHGDDQLGWEIVERLQGLNPSFTGIRAGRTPMECVPYLHEASRVIFVDAVYSGAAAGTLHKLDLRENAAESLHCLSSHGFCLTDILDLARSLQCLPRECVLFGIELDQCEVLAPLSEAVVNAIPRCIQALQEEMTLAL